MRDNLNEQPNFTDTNSLDHQLKIDKGQRKTLDALGIEDPRELQQYFELMKDIDLPFKHALPNFQLLREGVTTPQEELENWEIIKKSYDTFDWLAISKVPGLEPLLKLKRMVDLFDKLFREFVDKNINNPQPQATTELEGLLFLIKIEADKLNQCPAYIAYKFYGLYQIDPQSVPDDEYFRNR